MPKIRTKKGASKRFQLKKSGSVQHSKSGRRHILTKKTTKSKRDLRQKSFLSSSKESLTIRKVCPYL